MKNIHYLVLLLLCCTNQLFALDADVKYATFKGIGQENYIELYFNVKGKSVIFQELNDDDIYQAAVDIELYFYQQDTLAYQESFSMESPTIRTAYPAGIALVDMLRMPLPNGEYRLEVRLKDRHLDDNATLLNTFVKMNYETDEMAISDIQLLAGYERTEAESQYAKHGFLLQPFTFDVYPSFVNKMTFYTEFYDTDKAMTGKYLVRYYIQESGAAGVPITGIMGFKKQTAAPVNVILAQLDISTLAEGTYELVIEVRDAQNELQRSKALKIHRTYPFPDSEITDYEQIDFGGTWVEKLDKDRLHLAVRALSPLMVKDEMRTLNQVIRKKDDYHKRQLLCYFWSRLNEIDPEDPYEDYMRIVDFTNEQFTSAMGKGYQTDRGRVYLKYGAPDEVLTQQSEPSAPPYCVWFYNRTLDNQSDVKFVFYEANGDFELLHSTARSEIYDPQWKKKLYNRIPAYGQDALDGTGAPPHIGSQIDRIYGEW